VAGCTCACVGGRVRGGEGAGAGEEGTTTSCHGCTVQTLPLLPARCSCCINPVSRVAHNAGVYMLKRLTAVQQRCKQPPAVSGDGHGWGGQAAAAPHSPMTLSLAAALTATGLDDPGGGSPGTAAAAAPVAVVWQGRWRRCCCWWCRCRHGSCQTPGNLHSCKLGVLLLWHPCSWQGALLGSIFGCHPPADLRPRQAWMLRMHSR
jgi:hypothetical protein